MSNDDTSTAEEVPGQHDPASSVSRRTLIKTAAGVGVAAATIGVAGTAYASSPSSQRTGADTATSAHHGTTASAAGPVIVHVSDLGAGTLEIFTDGAVTSIRDHDLAGRIVRAAKG